MIDTRRRVVVDTNVLISASLTLGSTAAKAVEKALHKDLLLASSETLEEFWSVLQRPKFARSQQVHTRTAHFDSFKAVMKLVQVNRHVVDCRDPKDNKFLALALDGLADVIITGDKDLLVLHPWREIAILSPAAYLAL